MASGRRRLLVFDDLAGLENELLALDRLVLLYQLALRGQKTLAFPPIRLGAHRPFNTLRRHIDLLNSDVVIYPGSAQEQHIPVI